MAPGFSHLVCSIILFLALLNSLFPVSCFNQVGPLNSPPKVGLFFEGKGRLGSTPPSCHSKCNQCHPCMAVQVPTIPSHDRVGPGLTKTELLDYAYGGGGRYSNYKPLGWKCRCRDHFYNP